MKKESAQKQIATFIKTRREASNMTQKHFARALQTSQSAVARMEKGKQNFTTKQLSKISGVLKQNVVRIADLTDDFQITGGKKLHGTIETNTSKNGTMGLFCAALINKAPTVFHGIPKIEELYRMIEVFESIGVKIEWIAEHSIRITPPKVFRTESLNNVSAARIRSIIMLIGALVHNKKRFVIPHAGGCKMGERTIAAHRYALESLGVAITTKESVYEIKASKLHSADITLYEASDTAAENILIASALIPGTTTLRFAPPNYQVQEVCFFLEKLGVSIEGIGTTTLVIHGKREIKETIEYTNSEDPIESMMFIAAAIVTKSKLTITRCPIDFLRLELLKLEKMGLKTSYGKEYLSYNNRTKLVDITVYPSTMIAPPDKIHPLPYPGINSDNLPFFVPIATQVEGTTLIHDWMWENRAIYFTELNRLGASITLADPHRVLVQGPTKLVPAQIICPPALRPSMMILVAMLGAKGTSILRNVYAIKRGYERIDERLRSIGADIKILKSI